MVTKIEKDKDGNITSFSFIHSSSKGVNEMNYSMEKGLAGFELKGAQAWDTPEPNNSRISSIVNLITLPFTILNKGIVEPIQEVVKKVKNPQNGNLYD